MARSIGARVRSPGNAYCRRGPPALRTPRSPPRSSVFMHHSADGSSVLDSRLHARCHPDLRGSMSSIAVGRCPPPLPAVCASIVHYDSSGLGGPARIVTDTTTDSDPRMRGRLREAKDQCPVDEQVRRGTDDAVLPDGDHPVPAGSPGQSGVGRTCVDETTGSLTSVSLAARRGVGTRFPVEVHEVEVNLPGGTAGEEDRPFSCRGPYHPPRASRISGRRYASRIRDPAPSLSQSCLVRNGRAGLGVGGIESSRESSRTDIVLLVALLRSLAIARNAIRVHLSCPGS